LLINESLGKSRMPSTTAPDADELFVRLQAEDVAISRRTVAGDTVRVQTMTHVRDHHVDEDLSHVRVEVERVPIGQHVSSVPPIRQEGDTTILSVVEEIIVIERRLMLKEEVHIRRVHVAERHQETVAVREQSVEICRVEAASPAPGASGHPLASAPMPILQEQK
jgi:stress response protein YsnF